MKDFTYRTVHTVEEATHFLEEEGSLAMAGGTDLLGLLKDEAAVPYPKTIINLKGVEKLNYIREDDGLHIGALTTLADIGNHEAVRKRYPALAQAACSVASPLIRNQATIGGNLCQDVRCWYYRSPDQVAGCIDCARKEGTRCYAATGLLNQHSIFGGEKVCQTPCVSQCPANVDIPGYMALLREGDIDGAARILLENNPIPSMTSRVCVHFCQEGCNRNVSDERVGVGNVERYLGDYILDHADRLMPPPQKESGKKIVIIGSGPAGLSAAYYLRRSGHGVIVYERMPEPGGLLMYAIPAYRLPKERVRQLIHALEQMGVEFRCNSPVQSREELQSIKEEHDGVFIDTGAWKPSVLGIDGEKFTRFGLEFLIQVKAWMGENPGREVIVVGGGNVAVDVAVTARRLGAASVTMVSLESREELPATKEDVDQAEAEGIRLLHRWGPKSILRQGDRVTGIELRRCISLRDDQGRFSPSYDENEVMVVEGDAIFLAIGQQIDLSFLGGEPMVATERGRIRAEERTQLTSVPGIYAGGDAVTGPSTVVNALTAGRNAARAMIKEFGGDENCGSERRAGFLKFDPGAAMCTSTVPSHLRPLAERTVDLEDNLGLSPEEVMEEAKRCLNCGCLAVHPSDVLTALVVLEAKIVTDRETISAEQFAEEGIEKGRVITEIIVPPVQDSVVTSYDKFRQRASTDFAMTSLASAYKTEEGKITYARIVLGAVAPAPIRAKKAERYLIGREINEETASQAAILALEDASAPEALRYKINVAETLVKRSILRMS